MTRRFSRFILSSTLPLAILIGCGGEAEYIELSTPTASSTRSIDSTPTTIYVIQRLPVEFGDALDMVSSGDIKTISIDTIVADARFVLREGPTEWPGRGYSVALFEPERPEGIPVMNPGAPFIGLDEGDLNSFLEHVEDTNRERSCSILVFDTRFAAGNEGRAIGCD